MNNNETIQLRIVSPEKVIYDGEINRVTLPGTSGSFTILPHHAPIISSLQPGKIIYFTRDDVGHGIDIKSGFIEMSHGLVSVCISQ